MKKSALTLLFPFFAACAGDSSNISADLGDATSGADLYSVNCSGCHGATAGGGSGPAIAGEDDGEETVDVILNGEDGMPGFSETLSDQDISDILAYLATL